MITSLQSLLSWRPSFWLHLTILYSLTEHEQLLAQRRIAENNVAVARATLEDYERELRKVDAALRGFDQQAVDAGLELARRRAA